MGDFAGPSEGPLDYLIIPPNCGGGLVGKTYDPQLETGNAVATTAAPQTSNRRRRCVCSYCGNAFRRRKALVAHMRLHTGERPFKCDLCPKAYTAKSALRLHERRKHSNPTAPKTRGPPKTGDMQEGSGKARPGIEKKIGCDICSKLFKDSTTLRGHMREHELDGDRPYACNLCGASFATAGVFGEPPPEHPQAAGEEWRSSPVPTAPVTTQDTPRPTSDLSQ